MKVLDPGHTYEVDVYDLPKDEVPTKHLPNVNSWEIHKLPTCKICGHIVCPHAR